VEDLKKLLKRLAEEDRDFLRSIILEAVGDGGAEELVDVLLKSPRARARLAAELAAMITIPLNVATKDDIRALEARMATKEDIKALEARMATKEDLQRFATKDDLEKFATKEDLKRLEERMATKEDLKALEAKMATKEDLKALEERMATKEDLERFATKEDLKALEAKMATKEDLQRFATKEDLERFATKEELKALETSLREEIRRLEERMATKEDIRRLENKMATKEQVEDIALSLEEVARDYVVWFLKQRGVLCKASRLRLDGDYEFDVYCAAGGVTVVGEVKLRASAGAVERLVARVEEAVRRWPDKFQGRVVKVFYCMDASPEAVEKARELGVWLIEASRELTPLTL